MSFMGRVSVGLIQCRASRGDLETPQWTPSKVSQCPLTVEDTVCYLKTGGSGVDSQVESADSHPQDLISCSGTGIEPQVEEVLDARGDLESHGSCLN
jgi:hypothetical protein